jgi:hypothetical protein
VLQLQGSQVLFLTNCHVTPWPSVIHASDVTLSFLACSSPGYHEALLQQNNMLSTGLFHVAIGSDIISEEHVFSGRRENNCAMCQPPKMFSGLDVCFRC